jgi:hypothetical protein
LQVGLPGVGVGEAQNDPTGCLLGGEAEMSYDAFDFEQFVVELEHQTALFTRFRHRCRMQANAGAAVGKIHQLATPSHGVVFFGRQEVALSIAGRQRESRFEEGFDAHGIALVAALLTFGLLALFEVQDPFEKEHRPADDDWLCPSSWHGTVW